MKWLKNYKNISSGMKRIILAEFFLQLINGAFFMVFNFYLKELAFEDPFIAEIVSYRFLVVMLLAIPLGFAIPGKKLYPFFRLSAIAIPLSACLIYWACYTGNIPMIRWGMGLFGGANAVFHIMMVPFIMRNEPQGTRVEAIAFALYLVEYHRILNRWSCLTPSTSS